MKAALIGLLALLVIAPCQAQSYAIFSFDPPPGMSLQQVEAINNPGQILGTYLDSANTFHSILRSIDGTAYTPIEVPGATHTFGAGLNNVGQVIGSYDDAAGTHSFVRSATGTYLTFDIPSAGGAATSPGVPSAMNDNGDIVGTAFSGGGAQFGFFWSANRTAYFTVQVSGASATEVLGVNNEGEIVGTAQFGGSYGLKHGFLRKTDGSYLLIDAPGTALETRVRTINNHGEFLANGMLLNPDGSTAALDPALAGPATALDDDRRLAGCALANGVCRGFTAIPSVATQPVIRPVRGVISASGFGGFESIAPGSWIEIYGSNLAKAPQQWQSSDFLNGSAAPGSLGGVTVTINGQRAFLSYISPGQINAQAPSGLTAGPARVQVTNSNGTSAGHSVTVTASKPGILAFAQEVASEYALAIFPDFETYALPPILYPAVPPLPNVASRQPGPGDAIIFYGIGFANIAGQIFTTPAPLPGAVVVSIGGLPAQMLYSGPAPGTVGLYQFNVVVPEAHGIVGVEFRLNGIPVDQRLVLALQP